MSAPQPPSDRARFGNFELDIGAGELRCDGVRVPVPEQPLRLLEILVEHAGLVVSRDQLRDRLWASDTFVDFEHGLNAAVKRLRDVLGDSAETPRFVETMPRRGYRLIAPVERGDPVPVPVSAPPSPPARRRSWLTAAGALAVIAAAFAVLGSRGVDVWRMFGGHRRMTSVAVLPLVNRSGDATQEYFTDGITDHLIVGLGTIDGLKVISRTSVMTYKTSPEKKLP